jgi:4-amino-4-deoxy-L-arabinose transferase-like glycosyltransferase
MSPKVIDRLIALGIFLAVSGITCAASPKQGVNRDEAYYMRAGELYVSYWEDLARGAVDKPFSRPSIDRYWGYNHEHPPLMKLLYGMSWRLLHKCQCAAEAGWHPGTRLKPGERHPSFGVFERESTAFRLPTILFFGLLCALVYLFFVEAFGGRAGALTAALLTAAQPRAFFHAQTAGFDLPAATMWFATTYAYWRALRSPKPLRAGLVLGVIYGLFLATKLQSFFLPLALGVHWIVLAIRTRRFPNPWVILGMGVVAPLILLALWPWLWHDTVRRLGEYLGFHLNHVHYNFEYFGTNYNAPPYPIHEPLGMLLTTAPVVLIALALAGGVVFYRGRARGRDEVAANRALGTLLLAAAVVPILPFLTGRTPIFGETKHWLATMPILAILAGLAVEAIGRGLIAELRLEGRRPWRGAVLAGLITVAVLPAVFETARSHPYGLSHYNALAGGAPGGADLGMNRQFWGYSVGGLLRWFNETLPPQTKIYLHDWNHDSFEIYLRDGQLRSDLQDAGMEMPGVNNSSTALVIHELHFNKYEYMIWDAYRTVQPAKVLTLDGVPLVTVYRR